MTLDKLSLGVGLVALILAGIVFVKPANIPAPLGASPGPDRLNDCESRNGVTQCFTRKALSVGTTTSCAIKAPRQGTSTLENFTAVVNAGTNDITTAVTFTKGLTMQASTTALGGAFTSVADASGSFMASTTNAEQTRLIGPADWVHVNFAGGVGTASTTGYCNATFELI